MFSSDGTLISASAAPHCGGGLGGRGGGVGEAQTLVIIVNLLLGRARLLVNTLNHCSKERSNASSSDYTELCYWLFLECEKFGRMFDNAFPACAFFCFVFVFSAVTECSLTSFV